MTPLSPATVHRKLAVRIMAAGILIAGITGLGVWRTERNTVGRDILVGAQAGFATFNAAIGPLIQDPLRIDAAALQHAVTETMARRVENPLGRVVWIGITDTGGRRLAEAADAHPSAGLTDAVSRRTERLKRFSDLAFEVLVMSGSPHVRIVSALLNTGGETAAYGETVFAVAPEVLSAMRERAVRYGLISVAVVLITAALIYPVILTLLTRVTSLSSRLMEANLEMLKVLGSAIAKRDSDTDAHNYRVTLIAVALAEAVGLKADAMRRLIKGAFLHDVGKIGIPDAILHKPGPLTDDEFAAMKRHVNLGLDIVDQAEWIRDAGDIVGGHHEKFDGTGYASGRKDGQIPATARIFTIADVFDALISRRPYKAPFSLEKSLDIIRDGRGSHFDPALVDTFCTMAADIYATYAGREDDDLHRELDAVIRRYFHGA